MHAHDSSEQRVRLLREQMARTAAEESQQQLQMFLAMVTHELGNALSSIITNAQVLRRITTSPANPLITSHDNELQLGDVPAVRMESRVRAIEAAERRMRRLLDDLRDASQIGGGTFSLHRHPVNLLSIVERVRETYAEAARRRIVLDVHADRTDLGGEWDEERITQVLANIVSNALKYSPEGSPITIALAMSPRLEGAERTAEIRVTDCGAGITPEQIDRLFRPFSRLEQESATQGTGLGLYISKGIVEAHDGWLWVESKPGLGSTFCIALPLRVHEAPVPVAHDEPAALASGRQEIAPRASAESVAS